MLTQSKLCQEKGPGKVKLTGMKLIISPNDYQLVYKMWVLTFYAQYAFGMG